MNAVTNAMVLTCADLGYEPLAMLLGRYGMTVERVSPGTEIPGSYRAKARPV